MMFRYAFILEAALDAAWDKG